MIKRKMEGRGVFVNVKKRKEEKEENYQKYCQRREQKEKVWKEKEKLKNGKKRRQRKYSACRRSTGRRKMNSILMFLTYSSIFHILKYLTGLEPITALN